MRMPREKRTYCSHCRTHTPHEVLRVKKRKASELKGGQRQFRRVMRGYGGFPRPKITGAGKPTKKVSIILRCKTCKKAHNVVGFRVKKFEIVEA
jgi:large subunit ribosomal protein L44e